MKIRVEMVGGPLDGAVDLVEVPSGQFIDSYWIGPDPSRAQSHVIVYVLVPGSPERKERKRIFSQKLTDDENLKRGVEL